MPACAAPSSKIHTALAMETKYITYMASKWMHMLLNVVHCHFVCIASTQVLNHQKFIIIRPSHIESCAMESTWHPHSDRPHLARVARRALPHLRRVGRVLGIQAQRAARDRDALVARVVPAMWLVSFSLQRARHLRRTSGRDCSCSAPAQSGCRRSAHSHPRQARGSCHE
jgi:hypothetical protein